MTESIPASQERLLDAQAIEKAASTVTRPTARIHLESLAKKLRKEAEALKRVESSSNSDVDMKDSTSSNPSAPPLATAAAASPPTPVTTPPIATTPSIRYVSIDRFSFDAGGYDTPFVTLYIPLPGVGSIASDNVQCKFTKESFDLIVNDLQGKSYRLVKDNLEKDIDPTKSKYIIKSDKILLKLGKVKTSEYGGYDYWTQLTAKKERKQSGKKDDPQKGIMELMKDMYNEGDDNMRKIIGETFMKQQRGELGTPGMDDL